MAASCPASNLSIRMIGRAMSFSRRPRCAIFDLDGVLLDTEPLYTTATAQVAARFGKVYDWSVKRDCIGRGTLEAARIIVEALELPLSPEALVRRAGSRARRAARARAGDARARRHSRARSPAGGVPLAIATSTEAPLFAIKAARPPRRGWRSSAPRCAATTRASRAPSRRPTSSWPRPQTSAPPRQTAWCSRTRRSASRRRAPPGCR